MRLTSSLIGSRSSKAVYGVILITAVLIGFESKDTEPIQVIFRVIFAAFIIVLAEVYSEYLGEKIRHKRSLSRQERKEIAHDALAILVVSLYPAAVFLMSYFGLFTTATAYDISYTLSLAALGLFGYIASMYSGCTKFTAIKRAATAVFIGLIVILLKYEFGH